MKGNEENELVRAFKAQINIDRELEELKKQLSLKANFNLLDAFKILDKKVIISDLIENRSIQFALKIYIFISFNRREDILIRSNLNKP